MRARRSPPFSSQSPSPPWRGLRAAVLAGALAALGGACATGSDAPIDPALTEGLRLDEVSPGLLVPRSHLVVVGESFVGEEWGNTRLRLVGTIAGASVKLELPLRFVDETRLEVIWPGGVEAGLPVADGTLVGEATLVIAPRAGGADVLSAPLPVTLDLAETITPSVTSIQGEDTFTAYAWDRFFVRGDGFLLDEEEGQTVALLEGCVEVAVGDPCVPITTVELPTLPTSPRDRSEVAFRLSPELAGLGGGHFQGTIVLQNRSARGVTETAAQEFTVDVLPPTVRTFSPAAVSLGQYLFVDGGGFVPTTATSSTTLIVNGTITPSDGSDPREVSVEVPVEGLGRRARVIVDEAEEDDLSEALAARDGTGEFSGSVRVRVSWNGEVLESPDAQLVLTIAPMRQIIWLRFLPGYVQSLRYFGLRAVDRQIRRRIAAVLGKAYAGVQVEFREDLPEDFALYSIVEIVGKDPGGKDLFGYDNTPGKDVGNHRLEDRIGGINAATQADGSRGYGGIFVESLFGLSKHPNGLASQLAMSDALFDSIFDNFRPDLGSDPVRLSEIQGGVLEFANGDACPASDRRSQISCAIWVLGSLIGGTTAHEVGHSLGLANPQNPDVSSSHNLGDEPNRLMDSGGSRPFTERAELQGDGPGVFCDDEYDYLRDLMPSADPPPDVERPPCL